MAIPGAFAQYLEGTDDLGAAPDPDAVALRAAWQAAAVRRYGSGWSVSVSVPAQLLKVIEEHARTLLAIAGGGEVTRAEVTAAQLTLDRIRVARSD